MDNRIKLFGSAGEYRKLDYIEGADNRYINTGYNLWANSNWKIEMKFNIRQNRNYNLFFGTTRTTDPTYYEMWARDSGWFQCRLNNSTNNTSIYYTANTDYTLLLDNTGSNYLVYLDGTLMNTFGRYNTNISYPVTFLWRPSGAFFWGKVYGLKFWSNGSLVRDFVPMQRKADNVIGLYDKVGKSFYASAGSSPFTGG